MFDGFGGVFWRKIKGQQDREPLRGKSASERVSERSSEKPLKTLKKPLKTSETLPLRGPTLSEQISL